MTDVRKRIAELEEALGGINTHAQMGLLTAHEHKALNAYVQTALSLLPTLRAASLLSAAPPANKPDADVVERVAKEIYIWDQEQPGRAVRYNCGWRALPSHLKDKYLKAARAALSAMRPSVDWEKIEEGRRLLAAYEKPDFIARSADDDEAALAKYMLWHIRLFLYDLPQRIAELEEGLRPFAPTPEVLQAIQYIHDSGELYLSENGWQIGPITAGDLRRAASLLSDKPEPTERTPEQKAAFDELLRMDGDLYDVPVEETGDLERVARAISPYLMRSYSGTNPDADDQAAGRDTALHVAGLALSTIRPSVDDAKIAEIRARHEDWERDGFIKAGPTGAIHAHADRAFLLSVIEGVK